MLVNSKRTVHFGSKLKKFALIPEYKLKCGLEIHTQLNTKNKLFSLSTNDPFGSTDRPNTNTSYFDVALPGSQPILNHEVVLQAIKLSLALNCKINLNSQFDRKHYFYGDQPLGYQITQHYSPISSDGSLKLSSKFDDITETDDKLISIIQLQIEQDTGKSMYNQFNNLTMVDLNRSDVPLIEMVTKPDFTTLDQIKAFIKKYQNLVRYLGVSTGDLETGAMRVDVNVSINNFPRVELKNLPNTSSIMNAIKFEYNRQVGIIRNGEGDEKLSTSETRGWNGSETIKLRSKETTIDYRYMPDSELPRLKLSKCIPEKVKENLPLLPDDLFEKLTNKPYNLSFKDSKILVVNNNAHNLNYDNTDLRKFYFAVFDHYSREVGIQNLNTKLPINWIIHELIGDLHKLNLLLTDVITFLTPEIFAQLLVLIHNKTISSASGKLLLLHVLEDIQKSKGTSIPLKIDFKQLVKEFELETDVNSEAEEINSLCQSILDNLNNDKMLKDIISGKKKNSLKFLVGQGMRFSQGRLDAKQLENVFKMLLNIKW